VLLLLLACPRKAVPDTAVPDDTEGVSRWTGQGSVEDASTVLRGEADQQLDRALQTPDGLLLAAPQADSGRGQVCLGQWGVDCWTGPHEASYFGTSLAWLGEPVVGAWQDYTGGQWAGAVHLLDSGVVLEGSTGDLVGVSLAARDGILAIGAFGVDTTEQDAGLVYLVTEPSAVGDLADEGFVYGMDPGGQFGISTAWADLDGDGQADLLVGAPGATGEIIGTGAAFAFYGPVTDFTADRDADHVARGTWSGDQTGKSIVGGDTDGDGVDEWVIASPGVGRVQVMAGGALLATLQASEDGRMGFSLALVDVDEDGRADLLAGATRQGEGGELHVAYGPLAGELSSDLVLVAEGEGDKFGIGAGALDDGFWVGASRNNELAGAVYLFTP